jgi:hypothetical protein
VQLRAWVDYIFKDFIKPILNVISQIRGFLNILRSFGVQWAATLDKFLGQVQQDIQGVFLKVHGYLTAIIGIVSSLSDPLGLFRRPTFVMSLRRIFPSFMRGFTGMPLGYFFPSPRRGSSPWLAQPPANFDPTNRNMNPPPTAYLSGDDGLGAFGGVDPATTLPDDAMNDMTASDYFDDSLYPSPEFSDASQAASSTLDLMLGVPTVTA